MGDKKTKTKRIFINDVDAFSSKYIAKFLSTCLVGEEEEGDESSLRGEPAFQIVGTMSSSVKDDRNSGVFEHYVSPTCGELLQHLLECDVIVYNISENATQKLIDEATWALTTLHEEMEGFKSRKMFILISTVMTWGMTKPQNPDETDVPLSEEEFRRRRPHPNFRPLNELEKLVMKLGRTKKTRLPAYVVASGLQYGKGENIFHYFFKVSWLMQCQEVPIFGPGTNYIPMIHVYDLGAVIQNIIQFKPKSKYILAVDDSKNTLEEIVQAISTALGSGKIKQFTEQEAISMNALKAKELDYLKVSLSLDAFIIKDLQLKWISQTGMVENIHNIVEEYKITRKILPIKIFMVGPPAVGKTTIAKKLCDFYQLHYIKIQEVIEEKLRELEDPESQTQGSQEAMAAEQKEVKEILKDIEEDGGLSTDKKLSDILKEKLNSKPCLNQGFVLDGFPHTYEQAHLLFNYGNPPETEASISSEPIYNKKITPENIFVLNATDEFLIERVQELSESVAERMHYTQNTFLSRLKQFRERCVADETLLDYFEELEIFPEEIEINADDPEYTATLKKIIGLVGDPKNGLSPEELEEENRKREEERRQRLETEAAERKRTNEATLAEMAAQYQEWKKNLSELKRQQQELQSARSLPLRMYLMKYVMPSLSEALQDCSSVRPEDPVDFLAEHLLRNNMEKPQED